MSDFPYTLSEHAESRIKQRDLELDWIKKTVEEPQLLVDDPDDCTKVHAFKVIPEYGDRVLEVVYNSSQQPYHIITAYFNRKYKGKL